VLDIRTAPLWIGLLRFDLSLAYAKHCNRVRSNAQASIPVQVFLRFIIRHLRHAFAFAVPQEECRRWVSVAVVFFTNASEQVAYPLNPFVFYADSVDVSGLPRSIIIDPDLWVQNNERPAVQIRAPSIWPDLVEMFSGQSVLGG
jgi:hypothetical protein